MQASSHIAFKEWAAICGVLAAGRQSLILRKGGIHEGREGFHVAHQEFWLFPTGFHQEPDALLESGGTDYDRIVPPAPGEIELPLYAVVEEVHELHDATLLPRVHGLTFWSPQTIDQRFYYRAPGLSALVVRIYRRPFAHRIPDSPHFGGCRSWVELPGELSTEGLKPVIADAEHELALDRIHRALLVPVFA